MLDYYPSNVSTLLTTLLFPSSSKYMLHSKTHVHEIHVLDAIHQKLQTRYLSEVNKASITASQSGCPLLARLVQSDNIPATNLALCDSEVQFAQTSSLTLYQDKARNLLHSIPVRLFVYRPRQRPVAFHWISRCTLEFNLQIT